VALGRKNFLFAGLRWWWRKCRGDYSLVGSAKLNGIDPESYLRNVLSRIADHPIKHIEELLPWNVAASLQLPQPRGGINENAATNVPTNSLPELPYIEEDHRNGGINYRNHSSAERMCRCGSRGAPHASHAETSEG